MSVNGRVDIPLAAQVSARSSEAPSKVQALKSQIASGTFVIYPRVIAGKLLEEGV